MAICRLGHPLPDNDSQDAGPSHASAQNPSNTATQPPAQPAVSQDGAAATEPSFQSIADELAALANEAAEDDDDEAPSGSGSDITVKITISDMFDFANPHWQTTFQASSMASLAAEFEMHELIDLDADGVSDNFPNNGDLSQPSIAL